MLAGFTIIMHVVTVKVVPNNARLTLRVLGKISADDILKYFFFIPENRV